MSAPIPTGSLIALYAKPGHARGPELVADLEAWLRARGYQPLYNAAFRPAPALAVVLGGDGSMLHVAPKLAAAGTPVLAVHLGTLGFLTDTSLDDLYPSLETILAGRGAGTRRALLHVSVVRNGAILHESDVLNEAVVGKSGLARLLTIGLEIDGHSVSRYRADGVLIATPTGSTGYNFSAGGAVVHPDVAALLITPICPHALTERPLVVPASASIELTLQAGDPAFLTLDGQQGIALAAGDRMTCTQSRYALICVSAAPRYRFSPRFRPTREDTPT